MAAENGSSSSADETSTVTVTGTRTVAPAKSRCALATFDLPYITFYYNQKLLLYRAAAAGPLDFPDAVARMTAALADALRVFYPLAGRIRQDADGALAVEGDEGARSSRPRPRASPSTTSPEMAATRRPSGSCSASCPTPTRAWRFPRSSDKESIRDAGNLFDQMPERCSCWWS